jgi:hypothetical protein
MEIKDIERTVASMQTNMAVTLEIVKSIKEDALPRLEEKVKEIAQKQEAQYATKDQVKVVSDRVTDIEDSNKWLVRLIGGLVVTALIWLVIQKPF